MASRKPLKSMKERRTPCILILGLGYVGTELAKSLLSRGWNVVGTHRGEDPSLWSIPGLQLIHLDTSTKAKLENSRRRLRSAILLATHILATAPVNRETGTDPFIGNFGSELATASMLGNVQWVGYLSTTSVYGDHNGGWVDELTPVSPTLKRGRLRVNAERDWVWTGLPIHIFRLPGIYGPGRGTLAKVLKGRARCIVKENQYFSRIHVRDIVATLEASIALPNPGRVYNVVDNKPAPAHVVTEYCCELLGKDPPPRESLENADMSKMAKSFYVDSKRVSNRRIVEELGVQLQFPTYMEGLQSDVADLHRGLLPSAKPSHTILALVKVAIAKLQDAFSSLVRTMLHALSKYPAQALRMVMELFVTEHKYSKNEITCILVDNGSLKAAPTLILRELAKVLEERTGVQTVPVSARYADRVNVDSLGGEKAVVLNGFVKNQLASRKASKAHHAYVVLPLFLGPSGTVADFIPKALNPLATQRFAVEVAPVLFSPLPAIQLGDNSSIPKVHLGRVMADMVSQTVDKAGLVITAQAPLRVVLVDHGSPSPLVNGVRRGLTALLRRLLLERFHHAAVIDASMEKRDDPFYDFNKPLLEDVFHTPGWDLGDVVLAFAFLCPGRHAGPGGDIDEILEDAIREHRDLKVHKTGLIADHENHEALCDLLVENLKIAISRL